MASLIQELINTLEQEYEIYEQLIPIANEKTQIIVKNDLSSLQDITEKEQLVVDRINVLEHKREEVIRNIQTVISRKSEPLTIKVLIQLMDKQPKEQRALSVLYDGLKETVQRLVDINYRNSALIQQSLEMIEFNMNFFQSARMLPGNNTYTKGASRYDVQTQDTGIFDAKQ